MSFILDTRVWSHFSQDFFIQNKNHSLLKNSERFYIFVIIFKNKDGPVLDNNSTEEQTICTSSAGSSYQERLFPVEKGQR